MCKHDGGHNRVLQILLKIALKLQVGTDYDKKESKYQIYIQSQSQNQRFY